MRRPRHLPATIRTSGDACGDRDDISDLRLKPADSAVLLTLKAKRHVHRICNVELCNAVGKAPTDGFDLAVARRESQFQSVPTNEAR